MSSISPATVLAQLEPEFIEELDERERLVLACMWAVWSRPEQQIPRSRWRYYGFICGRGFGKSVAIANYINERVEAGDVSVIALMAPNDERADAFQVQALIDAAPPWFTPERYKGGLLWPNGARAYVFSAEAPDGPRGGNFHLSWLTEIVAWQHTTRLEAFNNITTATRVGLKQVLWDTTSKGKNEVLQMLLALNAEAPESYPIQRGEMFDNPLLDEEYLRSECRKYTIGTRAFDEEVKGLVFAESAGALWHQAWIDDHRRPMSPSSPILRLVGLDPAISLEEGSDSTGLVVACADASGDAYLEKDLSDRLPPETWCALAVDECANNGAAGIVIERNRGGEVNISLIRVHAEQRGMVIVKVEKDKPFPRRKPGTIFIREMWAATSKQSRAAAPASLSKAGRVHHVGPASAFSALELELTTWEPGTRLSPNRLDAYSYAVAELAGLNVEKPTDSPADVRVAAAAHTMLRERLAVVGRGRTI